MYLERSAARKCIDFITFPLRAPLAIPFGDNDRFGISSLQTERFDYVAKQVRGYCLDIGCGPDNRFVTRYLKGDGIGIDVTRHHGLSDENVVQDMTHLAFSDSVFDSVTFIANFNHIPRPIRVAELAEARRCLKHGGNVIVTAVTPLAWISVHKIGFLFEGVLGRPRSSEQDDELFCTDHDVVGVLERVGFCDVAKKYFITQWCLNHEFVGWKL
jgi:SAM-dependent methyltransferase